MKTCSKCNEYKPRSDFHICKANKSGLANACKECLLADSRTKDGVARAMFQGQAKKLPIELRPAYNLAEYRDWLYAQEMFHILHAIWRCEDYPKALKPSVDRIDDYIGYTFENMQLVTWEYNDNKHKADRKAGNNRKISNEINCYDIEGNFLKRYPSMREASRATNTNMAGIVKTLYGNWSQAGGYKWELHIRNSNKQKQ